MSAAAAPATEAEIARHVAELRGNREQVIAACNWMKQRAGASAAEASVIFAAGPLSAAIAALTRFAADDEALSAVEQLIAVLLQRSGCKAVDVVAAAGGEVALLGYLDEHISRPMITAFISETLARRIIQSRDASAVAAAGGVGRAVAALQVHVAAPSIAGSVSAAATCLMLAVCMAHAGDASASVVASLEAAGGLRALVDAIRVFVNEEAAVFEALTALNCAMVGDRRIAAVVDAGAVPLAVAAATRHVSSERLLELVIRFAVCVLRAVPSSTADIAGIIPSLVDGLRRHASQDFVLTALCATVSLTHADERWTCALAAAGAIQAVIPAAHAHVACQSIAQLACQLVNAMNAQPHAAQTVGAAGGVCLAVDALHAHWQCSDVVLPAVVMLTMLCAAEREATTAVARNVVVPLMEAACCHRLLPVPTRAIWCLMARLSGHSQLRGEVRRHGTVSIAIATLRGIDDDAAAAAHVCTTLANVSVADPGAVAEVVALGGVPALVTTWRRYAGSAPAVAACVRFLALACTVDKAAVAYLAAVGGAALTVSSLWMHHAHAGAAGALCWLINAMSADAAWRREALDAGILPLLTAMLAIQGHAPFQDRACDALCCMLADRQHSECDDCRGVPQSARHFLSAKVHPEVARITTAAVILPALADCTARPRASNASGCDCLRAAALNVLATTKEGQAAFSDAPHGLRALLSFIEGTGSACRSSSLHALAAVCHLAANENLRAAMISSRAVDSVVVNHLVPAPSGSVRELLAVSVLVRFSATAAGRSAIVAAGGVSALCCALRKSLVHGRVAQSAAAAPPVLVGGGANAAADDAEDNLTDVLRALSNVARLPVACAEMQSVGMVGEAGAIMVVATSAGVVAAACALLRAYAMGDGCERHLTDAGAAAALVCAIRTHSSNMNVLEHACGALWNIVGGGDEGCRDAVVKAGAADALAGVVALYPLPSLAGQLAQGAMDCLAH